MPAAVVVLTRWGLTDEVKKDLRRKYGGISIIDTTSNSKDHGKRLSPFILGPCILYDNYSASNVENAWQFSKVYAQHWNGKEKKPKDNYWSWAKEGWNDTRAHRYPMGKGQKPVGSWWNGELLGYIEARKRIYAPIYAKAVMCDDDYAFNYLYSRYIREECLVLLDYDAYDHRKLKMSLSDVLNHPTKKMGHAFVLAMLLTNDPALDEMVWA